MKKNILILIALVFIFQTGNAQEIKSPEDKTQPGMIAPEISGINILNDSPISLNALKGKYVFIDFWSTTCRPCISEFPNILKEYNNYDRNTFEVIGIVEDKTKGKIIPFLQSKNVIWPTIISRTSTTIKEGYTIRMFPASFLIDPEGKIIGKNLRRNQLNEMLKEHLSDKIQQQN